MKSARLVGLALSAMALGSAASATGNSRYADPNPALAACRVLQETAAWVPSARDKGIVREAATQEVLKALHGFGSSEDADLAWSAFVEEVYASAWTPTHIADRYRQLCAPYESLRIPLPFP
ncbi:hypothetical protein ANDO1_2491 [plant metagenome]|uniref:Uncharacterized protein n=1 Tax=plant metagenome TaxID=1297885 RepID=A0A484QB45_9ZZZZ